MLSQLIISMDDNGIIGIWKLYNGLIYIYNNNIYIY